MGQICSFCRYLCFCFKPRRRIQDRSFKLWEEQEWLTPSTIPDNQFTDDNFTVPSKDFEFIEQVFEHKGYQFNSFDEIGKGGFATVYKIVRIKDGKVFAVKAIHFKGDGDQKSSKKFLNLKNEIYVISKIEHKNITHLLDYFIINYKTFYLVMEFANSGTVYQEVMKSPITELKAKAYFMQMVKAVKYLHHYEPPIAHRDIKLPNILIHIENNEKIIKLTDFGFSRVLNQKTDGKIFRAKDPEGTIGYMSPQMLKLVLYKTAEDRRRLKKKMKRDLDTKIKTVNPIKADIWSLGVSLFHMVSGKLPFPLDEQLGYLKTVKEQYGNEREPIQNQKISLQLKRLFNQMLEPDTKQRIDIDGISQHEWLSGVSDVIILDKTEAKTKTKTIKDQNLINKTKKSPKK